MLRLELATTTVSRRRADARVDAAGQADVGLAANLGANRGGSVLRTSCLINRRADKPHGMGDAARQAHVGLTANLRTDGGDGVRGHAAGQAQQLRSSALVASGRESRATPCRRQGKHAGKAQGMIGRENGIHISAGFG